MYTHKYAACFNTSHPDFITGIGNTVKCRFTNQSAMVQASGFDGVATISRFLKCLSVLAKEPYKHGFFSETTYNESRLLIVAIPLNWDLHFELGSLSC